MISRRSILIAGGAAAIAGGGALMLNRGPDYDAATAALWSHRDPAEFMGLVHYTTLAANSHNAQAWRFRRTTEGGCDPTRHGTRPASGRFRSPPPLRFAGLRSRELDAGGGRCGAVLGDGIRHRWRGAHRDRARAGGKPRRAVRRDPRTPVHAVGFQRAPGTPQRSQRNASCGARCRVRIAADRGSREDRTGSGTDPCSKRYPSLGPGLCRGAGILVAL